MKNSLKNKIVFIVVLSQVFLILASLPAFYQAGTSSETKTGDLSSQSEDRSVTRIRVSQKENELTEFKPEVSLVDSSQELDKAVEAIAGGNPEVETEVKSEAPKSLYKKLVIQGQELAYEDGGAANGLAIIDGSRNLASTWGGAAINAVDDGASSHLIGHNPGIFSILLSLQLGETITAHDSRGNSKEYMVRRLLWVDDYARNLDNPSEDLWDVIAGRGQGEQIVLQTCLSDTVNLLMIAN